MRPCLITESDFYYRDVDFGEGMKARLRALTKFETVEATSELIKLKFKNEDGNVADYLNVNYKTILRSLTDISGKSFDEGGAGWNFENQKGEKLPVSLDILKMLNDEFVERLEKEFVELKKTIEDNKENALKN